MTTQVDPDSTGVPGDQDVVDTPAADRRRRVPRWAFAVSGAVAAAAFAATSVAVLHMIRSQGLAPTGDEPHYLVAALAIGRFHSLHVGAAYNYAVAHNTFITWSQPPTEQAYPSHGALFFFHEPGLPFLLAPGVAAAGLRGAEASLLVIATGLTTWLAYLVGRLSRVRSPLRLGVIALFMSPAYLLASTQMYPELLGGLGMAVVVAFIATMELERRSTWAQLVCCGVLLGYLPWLHPQNGLFAPLLMVALVAVHVRHRLRPGPVVVGFAIAAVSWLGVAAYNLHVFGHVEGPPGTIWSWTALGWTRILALLVDRQQGLFVQFPVIVLALAALWALRRKAPFAVAVTALITVVVVVLSGAYYNSYGGYSFVGRFNWSACPVLIAFAGLYLLTLWRRRPAVAAGLAAVIAALYALEAIPLVSGNHDYFSQAWPVPPQPAGPAWWGPVDRFLPSFAQLVAAWHSSRVVWGAAMMVVACAFLVYVAVAVWSGPFRRRLPVAAVLLAGLIAATAGTAASAAERLQPVVFPASALSGQVGQVAGATRTVSGPQHHGELVSGPDWTLPAGTYQATISYTLSDVDPNAAPAAVYLTPKGHPAGVVTRTDLPPVAHGAATVRFVVGAQEQFGVQVFWAGRGTLTVSSLRLTQVR